MGKKHLKQQALKTTIALTAFTAAGVLATNNVQADVTTSIR